MEFDLRLLRGSLDTSREGILIVDPKSRKTLLYNQKFLEILNFSNEDMLPANDNVLLKKFIATLINPDAFLRRIQEHYENPEAVAVDIIRMTNGRIIQRHTNPLIIEGEVKGRVWYFQDITEMERKRLAEKNRTELMTMMALSAPIEDILRAIVKGVEELRPNFLSTILILDHKREQFTHAVSRGLPLEMTKPLIGVYFDELLGTCAEAIRDGRRVIATDARELPYYSRLKHVFDFTGAVSSWSEPIKDAEGQVIGAFWSLFGSLLVPTAQDEAVLSDALSLAAIAVQKRRSEEEIKTQELRFRTIFESSNDAILLTNKDRVLDCNTRAWQLFEFDSKEDILSSRLSDYSPEFQPNGRRSAELVLEFARKIIERGSVQFDWLHKTKKGRVFPTECVISTYKVDDTRIALTTIRDISERHAAQKALDLEREKLIAASKMSSLGEMAGGVAHEINNPLAIIIGQLSRLRKRIARDRLDMDTLDEDLSKIETTALRIDKIIRGLRTFSRNAENDPFERCSLPDIISETLGLCQERIRHLSIDLTVENMDHGFILCRPGQISQVILNLLSNATDAVEGKEEAWIKLEARRDAEEENAIITVTDSGRGIDPKIWDKLMQPFFTTKEVGKGTGLGLSISRGITEDHGGTLVYDSSSPHTRFILTIPLLQDKGH